MSVKLGIFLMQEAVTVVGRICCDGNGRLNANSLLLEGSIETSSGRAVPLDVSNVPQFSLFPGQVRHSVIQLLNSSPNISACLWAILTLT